MSRVVIDTLGIAGLEEYLQRVPEIAQEAARLAVNKAARDSIPMASKQMREEVNFSRNYLGGENGRLSITKHAKTHDLEAVVKGRDRATSLARFATTPVRFGRQRGIKVRVNPNNSRTLGNAFYMRLRRGNKFDAENANVGLAVRVPKGETLRNSTGALDLGGGLYLLYGPSVDQVFQGVAADVVEDVADIMEDEFYRQFQRLSK